MTLPIDAVGRSGTPAGRFVAWIAGSAARHRVEGFRGRRPGMPPARRTIAFHVTAFTCIKAQ